MKLSKSAIISQREREGRRDNCSFTSVNYSLKELINLSNVTINIINLDYEQADSLTLKKEELHFELETYTKLRKLRIALINIL